MNFRRKFKEVEFDIKLGFVYIWAQFFNKYQGKGYFYMASHKSAKKRIRTTARKRKVNKIAESKIKTVVKKALLTNEKEQAEKLYKEAVAILDRSATKGLIHSNNASRKKSVLTKHLNGLKAAK